MEPLPPAPERPPNGSRTNSKRTSRDSSLAGVPIRAARRAGAAARQQRGELWWAWVFQSAHQLEPVRRPAGAGTLVSRQPGFRSSFAPPDAMPRGTGRDGWGRRVTAEAILDGLIASDKFCWTRHGQLRL